MLEQLFGSKTRVKILTLFLNNPDESFFVREIGRETDSLINSVRRELDNLTKAKILVITDEKKEADEEETNLKMRKYYRLNKDCVLVSEIKHLFIKNKVFFKEDFLEKIQKISDLKFLLLSGIFTDIQASSIDLLIVAEGNKDVIKALIKELEQSLGHEINYSLFTEEEFKYRKDLMDRFVIDLLNNKKNIVLLDKIKKNKI